jgi:ArsR family transcriptional regulator, lead/cadmium/zinc/bismuth-responsive transcriptional repressor
MEKLTVAMLVQMVILPVQAVVTLAAGVIPKGYPISFCMPEPPPNHFIEIPEDGEDACCDLPHSSHIGSPELLDQEPLSSEKAYRMAEFLGFLADPNRLRILSILATQEMCVGDLAATVGMNESAVSHQLRTLRAIRLVSSRKQGRHVFYRLQDDHVLNFYQAVVDHLDEPTA